MKLHYRFERILFLMLPLLFLCSGNLRAQEDGSYLSGPESQDEGQVARKGQVQGKIDEINKVMSTSTDSALALINPLIARWEREGNTHAVGRGKSFKSWILVFRARYEESLRLGHEALGIQRSIGDSAGIALTLNRIGLANSQFGRYADARKYISAALDYFEALKDTGRIDMALSNLGIVMYYQGEWQEAIKYYSRTVELGLTRNDDYDAGYAIYNIGQIYLEQEELDSAQKYFTLAQESFERFPEKEVPPLLFLSIGQMLKKQGKLAEAIESVQDALEQGKRIGHSELVLQARGLLPELYSRTGRFEEAYNAELEYRAQKEALDSANSAAQVAEVEERYKNAEKEAEILNLRAAKLQSENEAQRSNMLALYSVIGALFFGSGMVIVLLRRRQKQRIKESRLKSRIAETRLIALRAQMNPHFLFNCINTTQNFVLNSEKEAAYQYLSKFARLLRMVLENSGHTFIPLQDEIEQLQLYIELEKVRFNNKFDYRIDVGEELEDGIFEVPGMIIQPMIENAILHGLVNRDGTDGMLALSFRMNGEAIICEVTDNGVGREKAAELKARKKVHYQSAALPNVRERLQTLVGTADDHQLQITDLYCDGAPAGTKVVVHLPYC